MTQRSLKTPRLAALAAMALAAGHDVDIAAAATSRHTATGTNDWDFTGQANALCIKAEFCPHAGGTDNFATPEQVTTDIAGAKGAKKIRGLGKSARVNSIGIDGYGMAGAPAAKKVTIEAGVIDFGTKTVTVGMTSDVALLVAASSGKKGGMATARRHR